MRASKRAQHAILIQGLREKIGPTGGHGFLCRCAIRGNEDDGDRRERWKALQPFVNEKTFRGGHVDVEENQIRLLDPRNLHGLIPVSCQNQLEVSSLHPGADERAHIRVVVHQKDLHHTV